MKILFVCSGNMVRSQIAEAFYNSLTNSHDATSAGVAAIGVDFVSKRAIAVMDEIGVSLDGHHSKQLTPKMVERADRIILFTVDDEPSYVSVSNKVEYWGIEDLGYGQEDSLALDRQVRDEIREKVGQLVGGQ